MDQGEQVKDLLAAAEGLAWDENTVDEDPNGHASEVYRAETAREHPGTMEPATQSASRPENPASEAKNETTSEQISEIIKEKG